VRRHPQVIGRRRAAGHRQVRERKIRTDHRRDASTVEVAAAAVRVGAPGPTPSTRSSRYRPPSAARSWRRCQAPSWARRSSQLHRGERIAARARQVDRLARACRRRPDFEAPIVKRLGRPGAAVSASCTVPEEINGWPRSSW
jgi:hypothetical protein